MKLHSIIILMVPVVGMCLFIAVKSMSETVHIVPKMATRTYGQLACFNCTTSHLEAHWQVEDEIIKGEADHVNGLTFISRCFNTTENMNVTCHGVTSTPSNKMPPGADTAEVILIQDPPTSAQTNAQNTDAPYTSATLAVYLIGGNGSLIGSGTISLTLLFNISSDSEGNPQHICAEIKHPIGENTTTCTSQYQHDGYHSLVATVHWMFDPSIVNVCGLNLTVQLTVVHKNTSSPFSNPITVPVGNFTVGANNHDYCQGEDSTNRPSGSWVTVTVPVVIVVAVVAVIAVVAVVAGLVIALLLYYKRCNVRTKDIETGKGELPNGGSTWKTENMSSIPGRPSNEVGPIPPRPLSLVLEPNKIVVTERDSTNENEKESVNVAMETGDSQDCSSEMVLTPQQLTPIVQLSRQYKKVELPDCLKTPDPKVHSLSPVDTCDDIVPTENVIEQPTSSKPPHLSPEEKKEEETAEILDTGTDICTENDTRSEESTEHPLFEEGKSAKQDPENSALIAPQLPRRLSSFGLSLRRTTKGNDTVDENSIQDGCKSPDQSLFPVLREGSEVFGPQLIGAHGHRDSSSGVPEDTTYSSPEPTSPKPPLHIRHLPLKEKEDKEPGRASPTENAHIMEERQEP